MTDRRLRILLVEDNSSHVLLVRRSFEDAGETVDLSVVATLAEARQCLRDLTPDVLLVDYLLTDGKGTELLPGAGAEAAWPVIMLTSHGDQRVAVEAMKAGALDYVVKSGGALGDMPRVVRRVLRDWEHVVQRRRAEETLRASEKRYRELVEEINDVIVSVDSEGLITYVSPVVERRYGYRPTDLLGRHLSEFVHECDLAEMGERLKDALSGVGLTGDCRIVTASGEMRWVRANIYPISGKDGFSGIRGVLTDITDSKHAEAEERARTEELRLQMAALSAAASGIVITDRDGVIQWVNPAFTAITGYSAEEAIGQSPRFLKSGRQDREFYHRMWQTILAGEVWHGELVNRARNGRLYTEEMTIAPVRDAGGAVTRFIAIKQDVTSRKDLEQQLVQAQKMEVVGHFASSIAHDFNNQLFAMRGYAEMLVKRLAGDKMLGGAAAEVLAACEQGERISRQLLNFSRRQTSEPVVTDVNAELSRMAQTLGRMVGEHVEVLLRNKTDVGLVRMDCGRFEQAMMNLVLNARDAMPRGGKLTIETAAVEDEPDPSGDHGDGPVSPYVRVSVTDTGIGMDAATREKIFEPFFTTKGAGKGTGLGLPSVLAFASQSGGRVAVYSQPDRGTTFRIYLPCLPGDTVLAGAPETEDAMEIPGGSETILVAEDEAPVRRVVRGILSSAGYTVIEAENGNVALEVAGRVHCEIDLLITDLIMPELGGRELAEVLRVRVPRIKTLFMSGYPPDAWGDEDASGLAGEVMLKPIRTRELLRRVRSVLDG